MRNYELVIQLLKKWPVDKSKGTRCYGNHLRELARKSFPSGDLFSGSEAENKKMLQSLMRLANNTYGEKYSYRRTTAASGYQYDFLRKLLSDEYASQGFTRIDSK